MFEPMGRPSAESRTRDHARDPLFVRSVQRAFSVLSAFEHASGPLTLAGIAERSGLDRSATLRELGADRPLRGRGGARDPHGEWG